MGDAAMTVPVIKNLLNQYPDVSVTVASDAFFQPIFAGIERCDFIGAEVRTKHKGLPGLYKLSREIKTQYTIDAVADFHDVLRTKILRKFFSFTQTAVIDKGRSEKAKLTRKENKELKPLKSTHLRYADVLAELGFPVTLNYEGSLKENQVLPQGFENTGKKLIGVAPFAKHTGKTYPRMRAVVELLAKDPQKQILLFGGKADKPELDTWASMPNIENLAGKFAFTEELQIISNLNLMVSMDSANMHLASLYGVPVVSVWGATHPFAGFTGWGQSFENIVQADLFCRPCSVFGNKPCYRGNYECMEIINPADIINRIQYYFEKN